MTIHTRCCTRARSTLACSRLSVSENDQKSERATSRISCERDPGVKRRGHARSFFNRPHSSPVSFFKRPHYLKRLLHPHYQRAWNRLDQLTPRAHIHSLSRPTDANYINLRRGCSTHVTYMMYIKEQFLHQ